MQILVEKTKTSLFIPHEFALFGVIGVSRTVLIENPTPFEVRWNFTTQEVPSKCFYFDPEQGGTLDAFSSQPLNIVYEAPPKPSTAQCRLTFRCTDVEGIANGSEVKIMQSEQRHRHFTTPIRLLHSFPFRTRGIALICVCWISFGRSLLY